MEDFIEKALRDKVQKEVEIEFDRLKKQLLDDLEYKKNEICAGVILNVMEEVEINTINKKIIFSIKKLNG